MTDDRLEDEALPANGGRAARLRQFLAAGILRSIDAAIGLLQSLRNRIEAPIDEEEDPRNGRKRLSAHGSDHALPPVAEPPKPRRLHRFLVLVLVLIVGSVSGMTFSYRLLSRSLNAKESIIEFLKDEIAQQEKGEARTLNEMAKHQKKIYENEKTISAYQEEIQDYKNQVEELSSQLSALKTPPAEPIIQNEHANRAGAARSKRPTPGKTGNCVMGTANATANMAQCLEDFNRK